MDVFECEGLCWVGACPGGFAMTLKKGARCAGGGDTLWQGHGYYCSVNVLLDKISLEEVI